jgi:predicted cupin superfamily sugar epimerase
VDPEIQALIAHFNLQILPVEGTLFNQTYRSVEKTATGELAGSAIVGLFCEEPRSFSCFHTLTHDEMWHFYRGDPLRLVLMYPDGSSEDVILGSDLAAGQRVQFVVPAGVMQAGELVAGGRFALYGCTMAPGFSAASFAAPNEAALLARWPERAADIARLCVRGDATMPEGI